MSRAAFNSLGEDDDEDDPRKHECRGKMNQGEVAFNFKQKNLQTDMEMPGSLKASLKDSRWFMEAIPDIFGVEDSDELDESLQEDAQDMRQTLLAWLAQCPDAARRDDFVGKAVSKALKVHLAGKR